MYVYYVLQDYIYTIYYNDKTIITYSQQVYIYMDYLGMVADIYVHVVM